MAVTLREIAERCNVSQVTVSHVLRNPEHPRYAKTTKEAVLRVADELQYSPNLVARSLKRGKTNLLGVVIPFNDPGVVDRIEYIAQERGYAVMVQFSPTPNREAEARALKSAIDRKVDGIIWQPCSTRSMRDETLQMIRAARIPVVQMQVRVPQFTEADFVGIDWRAAIGAAVRHLEACGYERLVYLNKSEASYEPLGERARMFEECLIERGLNGKVLVVDDGDFARAAREDLHTTGDQTTAYFGQGVQTVKVLDAVCQAGRRVPQDVGVLLFGDMLLGGMHYLSELPAVKLSCLNMPEVAQPAMNTLIERIEKRITGPGIERIMDVSLVERESTVVLKR